MNNSDYWERFEKTGRISDYLSYTACTAEDAIRSFMNELKEGGICDSGINCDGDGTISNAHRRL